MLVSVIAVSIFLYPDDSPGVEIRYAQVSYYVSCINTGN